MWGILRPRSGVLVVGLVLMLINRVSGLVLPASARYLVDDVFANDEMGLLLPLVLVVIGATIIQGASSFVLAQMLSRSAQRLITQLRCRVQEHMLRLPVSYYDTHKTGTLVSRVMNDAEGVRSLLGSGMLDFVGGLLTAVVALGALLLISPTMTGLAFAALVIFGLMATRVFAAVRPIVKERSQITAEISGRLTESFAGIRVVKGYHAQAREAAAFQSGAGRLLANVERTLFAIGLANLSSAVMLGGVGALVMYFGARQITAGDLTIGGFFTYTLFLGFLVVPMFQVAGIGTQLTEALTGLERIMEVLREKPEDVEPARTRGMDPIAGEVVFEDVSFSYGSGAAPVLRDVSFRAAPGTVTALVGPSGAGKSTVIGLIAAFAKPGSGSVRVDDVDLASVRLDSYRTQLGLVLQDSFLFDGSIRDNVAFARPDAPWEHVLRACRIARVDEFAERMQAGYDTVVGERGVRLSGGQCQRVSIARAILADPRILILDEATSSLDSESESLIQAGLSYLFEGRSTFVIAHRLSTIRRADQILVLEDGRIVERGDHESLYASRGRYHEMYTRQQGLAANLFLAPGESDSIADGEPSRPQMEA